MALTPVSTVKDLLANAHEAEVSEDFDTAIDVYKKTIATDPSVEPAYDRLMIIYRKLKDYKKELKIIDQGIKAFEKLYKPKATARIKKVAELSLKLNKSVGLVDKKGEAVYEPEPIARWKKRRAMVEKKLK